MSSKSSLIQTWEYYISHKSQSPDWAYELYPGLQIMHLNDLDGVITHYSQFNMCDSQFIIYGAILKSSIADNKHFSSPDNST